MKITNLEAWQVSMGLAEPYTIAYETIDSAVNVFLHVQTNSGISGYGCAAPDLQVTGETPATVLHALNNVVAPCIKGFDPIRQAVIFEKLKSDMQSHPSALAALDMALWDIIGKKSDVPLWKLLGGYRECIKTGITIGILPANEAVEHARGFIDQGFKIIKLKGGINVNSDIERVVKVREEVGRDVELLFDANQGFNVEDSLKFIDQTLDARVELIEQPIPKAKPEMLEQVSRSSSIPVMADESLMTLSDAFKIAQGGFADMFNIKLMKVGGISTALQIDSVAISSGIKVMVGCMDESALAIAAGLHFTLARPNVVYADLDGHLDLLNDPSKDAVMLKNGILYPTDKPGLGFDLK